MLSGSSQGQIFDIAGQVPVARCLQIDSHSFLRTLVHNDHRIFAVQRSSNHTTARHHFELLLRTRIAHAASAMSKADYNTKVTPPYHRPGLFVLGVGVEYPPYLIESKDVATLARRFYPSTPALEKVLTINEYTGIDTRSAIGTIDHPIVNQKNAPSIAELCDLFLDHGVKLSVAACQKAIEQWGGDLSEITHIVSTTCTNSANPGFDHFVVKELGLNTNIEKVLLHGIGCSGGLAALRTAANIALGSSFRRRPARILVLACEISSILVRSELDSIHQNEEVRIGATLFSDCASAMVLGNEFSNRDGEENILELLGWDHRIIDDTEKDLGFDVDPLGKYAIHQQASCMLTSFRLESRPHASSAENGTSCCAGNVRRSCRLDTRACRCWQAEGLRL